MHEIKIIDAQFIGSKSFGTGNLMVGPTNFEWNHGSGDSDVVFFSESGAHQVIKYPNKIKIGMIIEPRVISPGTYINFKNEKIKKNFDLILTYDDELLKSDPEVFKLYTFGGCWIFPEQQRIHKKTKGISTIASSKNFSKGHKLRHVAIKKYRDFIGGIYGGGYKFVENKIEALKNYRFSLTIENGKQINLFTEKIVDCFMTGTVPIYWGCPNVEDFFNPAGILKFNNIEELGEILKECNEEKYTSMLSAIKENFEIAKKYKIPEDYIWHNYLKNII